MTAEGNQHVVGLCGYSPLINFYQPRDETRFPDGIVISHPTSDELDNIKSDRRLWLYLRSSSPKFVLRTRFHNAFKDEEIAESRLKSELFQFLRALRLFKRGSVGLGPLFLETSPGILLGEDPDPWATSDILSGYTYNLMNDELRHFNRHYNLFRNCDFSKYPELEIALLRFDLAYQVRPYERLYRLVDLITGLESLYLDNEPGLAYKLAIRSAYLLGSNKLQREEIFWVLKHAYNLRSSIVHGGRRVLRQNVVKIETDKGMFLNYSFDDFIFEIEDILRKSITKFLRLSKLQIKHKDFLKFKLDANVLSAGRFL